MYQEKNITEVFSRKTYKLKMILTFCEKMYTHFYNFIKKDPKKSISKDHVIINIPSDLNV